MEDIVIVAAARTAVGKFGGSLAKVAAPELGGTVLANLLQRTGVAADQIGEVIMGQVLAAGSGQNPARQSVIKGGLHQATPALTINAVCGSGLKAVMLAAQAVATQSFRRAGNLLAGPTQWLRFFAAGGLTTPAMWPEAPMTKRLGPGRCWVDA